MPLATATSINAEPSSPGSSSGSDGGLIFGCDMPVMGPSIVVEADAFMFIGIIDARNTATIIIANSFFILSLSPNFIGEIM